MPFVRPFPGSAIGTGQIVSAGDLTGAVVSDIMDLSGINELTISIDVTRPAAGVTAVQMFQEIVIGGNAFILQDREETVPPVKTLDDEEDSKAIPGAGTTRYSVPLKVASIPDLQLRFTATAAAAGDVVDVFANGSA